MGTFTLSLNMDWVIGSQLTRCSVNYTVVKLSNPNFDDGMTTVTLGHDIQFHQVILCSKIVLVISSDLFGVVSHGSQCIFDEVAK